MKKVAAALAALAAFAAGGVWLWRRNLSAGAADAQPEAQPVADAPELPVSFLRARFPEASIPMAEVVDLVVLHTAETDRGANTAEAVAKYFSAMDDGRKASAHYVVDAGHVWQCLQESEQAWHAPPVNDRSIGVEHAGKAAQTAEEWADDYSARELGLSAQLVRGICARHDVPTEYVDAAGLREGRRGITTHAEVTAAFGASNHTDPGPNFPIQRYLELVRGGTGVA